MRTGIRCHVRSSNGRRAESENTTVMGGREIYFKMTVSSFPERRNDTLSYSQILLRRNIYFDCFRLVRAQSRQTSSSSYTNRSMPKHLYISFFHLCSLLGLIFNLAPCFELHFSLYNFINCIRNPCSLFNNCFLYLSSNCSQSGYWTELKLFIKLYGPYTLLTLAEYLLKPKSELIRTYVPSKLFTNYICK